MDYGDQLAPLISYLRVMKLVTVGFLSLYSI